MRNLPTEKNERIKVTNLRSQKFILKHDINHFLHYFFGARLFNGELLEYKNVRNNQVFQFKDETYLIEILHKDEASDLVY